MFALLCMFCVCVYGVNVNRWRMDIQMCVCDFECGELCEVAVCTCVGCVSGWLCAYMCVQHGVSGCIYLCGWKVSSCMCVSTLCRCVLAGIKCMTLTSQCTLAK